MLLQWTHLIELLLQSQSPAQDTTPLPERENFLIEFQANRPSLYRFGSVGDVTRLYGTVRVVNPFADL